MTANGSWVQASEVKAAATAMNLSLTVNIKGNMLWKQIYHSQTYAPDDESSTINNLQLLLSDNHYTVLVPIKHEQSNRRHSKKINYRGRTKSSRISSNLDEQWKLSHQKKKSKPEPDEGSLNQETTEPYANSGYCYKVINAIKKNLNISKWIATFNHIQNVMKGRLDMKIIRGMCIGCSRDKNYPKMFSSHNNITVTHRCTVTAQ